MKERTYELIGGPMDGQFMQVPVRDPQPSVPVYPSGDRYVSRCWKRLWWFQYEGRRLATPITVANETCSITWVGSLRRWPSAWPQPPGKSRRQHGRK